ncbi:MAG TPA: hypothetical protein VHE81_17430 [Lacipirellulaceae bacterium]|nr:hypothetical protein [Lacipirellulaceae bacterium]
MIEEGGAVDVVAGKTISASDKAFAAIQNDRGFSEVVWLMTQLAVAATQMDPQSYLEGEGLRLSQTTSVAEVALAIHEAVDAKLDRIHQRSDFGEMAQNALVSAVTEHLDTTLGTLISPSAAEAHGALSKLGRVGEFGKVARSFFARLSQQCLEYFLSKTVGAQIGDGRRFSTTAQVAEYESAMRTHSFEAAAIVEKFSAEWFSKNRFEGSGKIDREKSDGFGWYALQKMRAEMSSRATPNGL